MSQFIKATISMLTRSKKEKASKEVKNDETAQNHGHLEINQAEREKDLKSVGKLYAEGLNLSTTSKELTAYFSRFGKVIDSAVERYPDTKKSRGFGFVVFADPADAEVALEDRIHILDEKVIKVRRAFCFEEPRRTSTETIDRTRLFLGGLPSTATEEHLKQFFSKYGKVVEAVIPFDKITKKPKGFGFLKFEDVTAAEKCKADAFVYVHGKRVCIKDAHCRKSSEKTNKFRTGSPNVEQHSETNEPFCGCVGEDEDARSLTSGEDQLKFREQFKLHQLLEDCFSHKFALSDARDEKDLKDKNKKWSAHDIELEEIMKRLKNSSLDGSEKAGDSEKSLTDVSDTSEFECTSNEENGTDEEDSDKVASDVYDAEFLEFLKGKIASPAGAAADLSVSVLKDGETNDVQKSPSALKIKDNKGSMICSLCQWTPPNDSFQSFLAHCRTAGHRTKLKNRFPKEEIQENMQEVDSKLISKMSSGKAPKMILDVQNDTTQQNSQKNKSIQLKKSEISTSENKESREAEDRKRRNAKQDFKQKMKKNKKAVRNLKMYALAKGMSCIQPVTKDTLCCKMCKKVIPKSSDLNNLVRNVSSHLQSNNHLKKLLETESSLKKELDKNLKKRRAYCHKYKNFSQTNASKKTKKLQQQKCSGERNALPTKQNSTQEKDDKVKHPLPNDEFNSSQKKENIKKSHETALYLCLFCNQKFLKKEDIKCHINSKSHLNCLNGKNVKCSFSPNSLKECKNCKAFCYGSLYDVSNHYSKCAKHV